MGVRSASEGMEAVTDSQPRNGRFQSWFRSSQCLTLFVLLLLAAEVCPSTLRGPFPLMRRKYAQPALPNLYFRDGVLSVPGYTFDKVCQPRLTQWSPPCID